MAVTVTTHSQAGTWTAAQLRSLFETSFIANGIMTAWYDSFTSGSCALGVVERVYDGAKTYGTSYYVFKFSTTNIFVYVCDSWDAVNHVPDGTVHDTYASGYSFSSTSGGNGDFTFQNVTGASSKTTSVSYGSAVAFTLSSTTTAELVCYTSGVDTAFKWFEFRQGTNYGSFMFPVGVASNFDLNTWFVNYLITVNGIRSSAGSTQLNFACLASGTRRGLISGSTCGTDTSVTLADAAYLAAISACYRFETSFSNTSTGNGTTQSTASEASIRLPGTRAAQLNTPLPADLYYVHTGVFYNPYDATPNMPADFGIYVAQDGNTAIVNRDVLVVSSGVEEYTILHATPANTGSDGYGWGAFVARTV